MTLILMNAAGELPLDRPDLHRLARGDSYVRPIESARVTARNGGRPVVVDGEIAPSVPLEAMTSNKMIDVNREYDLIQGLQQCWFSRTPIWASYLLLCRLPCRMWIRLLPLEFRRLFQCLGP